jgi:hypothetical protein
MKTFLHTALVALILAIFPAVADASSLYVSPASASAENEGTVSVTVYVSSTAQAMNAASAVLSFPTDKLSVTSVSKAGSIVNFWAAEPDYSNSAGTVSLEGVVLNPGYTGSAGKLVTITFRAKTTGTASLSFTNGSVLANDGQGTNTLDDLRSGTITISAATEKPVPKVETPKPKVTEPKTPEEEETPIVATSTPVSDAPIITLGSEIVGGEERQVIYGLSKYPGVIATVYFGPADAATLRVGILTAADGSFTITVPDVLKPSTYPIRATVMRPDGTESPASEMFEIRIPPSLASYAWNLIPYLSIGVLVLLVVAALFFIFWYGSLKLIKKQNQLGKETHEAQTALHQSFEVLRKDIAAHLKQIRGAESLEPADEKDMLVGLKKDIDDAEGYIKKEIDDISKRGG